MSQQGIFSIAPDSQPASSNGANGANGTQANSPFSAVGEDSPFASVAANRSEEPRGGIPARRPSGQPPALGGTPADEASAEGQQAVFQPVAQSAAEEVPAGGPFQINGFPSNGSNDQMEAAPVAAVPAPSPFTVVAEDRPDYEAAKAALEPQQDFAAVQTPFTPAAEPAAEPVQATQPALAPQAQQAAASYPYAQPAAQHQEAQPIQAQAAAPVMQQPVQVQQPAQAAQVEANVSPAFQQLELRAIFGVDHLLDQQEILQRARTLPGVRNVAVVGANEANALSNFRQAMQGMGFGDSDSMKLSSGGGVVDFVSEGETTVAILHEGGYAPGVKETLIIVAREIGKIS
ncbi:MAG: hypothetical protein ACPG32_01105 [Akkermansiaceae bacterium]